MSRLSYRASLSRIINRDISDKKYSKDIKDINPSYFTLKSGNSEKIKFIEKKYKFDELDLVMAKFSWEVYQLYRLGKLSDIQLKKSESLLEDYRHYVQKYNNTKSDNGLKYSMSRSSSPEFYTPEERDYEGDGKQEMDGSELVSRLEELDVMNVPSRDFKGRRIVDRSRVFDDYGIIIPPNSDKNIFDIIRGTSSASSFRRDSSSPKAAVASSSSSSISMPKKEKEKILKKIELSLEKIDVSDIPDNEVKDARSVLFGDRKEDVDNRDQMFREILRNQNEQMDIIRSQLSHSVLGSDTSKTDIFGARIDRIEKMTSKTADQVSELMKDMIRNQELSSVSWKNLPDYVKLLWAKGFWNFTIEASIIPITLPYKLVNNILIKPAFYSTKILLEKLYFLWGCVAIVIIVGQVAHVYISNEEYIVDKFSSFINSENIFIAGATNYIVYPTQLIYSQLLSRQELFDVWRKITSGLLDQLYEGMLTSFDRFKTFIYDTSSNIISEQLAKLNPFKKFW